MSWLAIHCELAQGRRGWLRVQSICFLVFEQYPILAGRNCPSTGADIPFGRYLLAPLTGNNEEAYDTPG